MCLLSVYSPGSVVNTDHLEAGAFCNPDGYGFAIVADGRIETGRGMDPVATIDAFCRVRDRHPDGWALFHSRYTTDGVTSEDNCHPFIVGNDARTVLAHNGVLPKAARPGKNDPRSDTRILAEDLIPGGMFGGPLHRRRARIRLERWLTSESYPNKVAILTVDRRFKENAYILNERAGTWVDGVWHSNDGYVPYMPSLPMWSQSDGDAWGMYSRGEISYSDYVDMKYGIKKDSGNCFVCSAEPHWVDKAYMYCRACKTCLDCLADIAECDCWVPSSQRQEANPDTDTLSQASVDAALEKLPADAAARVRAALNASPTGYPL